MQSTYLTIVAFTMLAVPPPMEIEWHPVEQLTGSVEKVKLITAAGEKEPQSVVVITGLVPQTRQAATVGQSLQISSEKAGDLVQVIDFTLERQELKTGVQTPGRSVTWDKVDIAAAEKLLQQSTMQADIVPQPQIDPVFTMPLPEIVGGWPKSVTHPKLTAEHQLFRFIDFTAKPGHHYRYRVRFEYSNPNFEDSPDPFIAAGETRDSPWSAPTLTVTVPN